MKGVKLESKSESLQQDSQITPGNSAWLAEHVKGFKKGIYEILKLIAHDGKFSEMRIEIYDQRKFDMTTQVAELFRIYGELADQYQNLIGEFSKNCPSTMKKQHLDSSDPTSPQVTQMSSPDQTSNTQEFSTSIGFDAVLKVKESKPHEELLQKIANLEEELASLNTKFQSLADENTKLMEKIDENESATELASDLEGQLEYAKDSIGVLNSVLEAKKSKEGELEKQVSDLFLLLSHSKGKMEMMDVELETSRKKLLTTEDEILKLKRKISGKGSEETQTKLWEDQLGSTNQLIEIFQKQLESQSESIVGLQRIVSLKTDALKVCDDQILELKIKLKQLSSEIERLTAELSQKNQLVDDMNKEMDGLKQKSDEMSSRDNLARKQETRWKSLRAEHERIVSSFIGVQKVINELEREVGRQRELLLDRAEEKKKVIRHLTFALEHYMSRYKGLCQAFIGHRK